MITELPAAEEAAIEQRAGEMADAERQIEVMRRGALKQPEPSQTPTAAPTPVPGAAGAPVVPANNPNVQEPVTPSDEPGPPLVPPTSNVR